MSTVRRQIVFFAISMLASVPRFLRPRQSIESVDVRSDPTSGAPGAALPVLEQAERTDPVPAPDGPARDASRRAPAETLGWFVPTAVLSAVMLAVISLADGLSRSGRPHGGIPFWFGLIVPIGVIAFRQARRDVGRTERIALTLLAGLFLYLVKVLRDPHVFTFADEFIQVYNTDAVLRHGALFSSNPLLPATPDYPGLASVTAAFASLTGVNAFTAGLIVIGAARLTMVLAVFLLFERVTGSRRAAGIGVLVYASAPNFLYFTAEVSYESYALPIAAAAVYAIVSWSRNASGRRIPWAVAATIFIATVVISHHMTSYALAVFLAALFLAERLTRAPWKRSVLPFLLFTLGLIVTWLVFVATQTFGYLEPAFVRAIRSTIDAIAREGAGTRSPFAAGGGPPVPLWDKSLSIVAIVVIVALIPLGLYDVWRRYRREPVVLVLAAAGVSSLGTLGLRFVPAAWEIANRSSEFLFLGVGLVLALAWTNTPGRISASRRRLGFTVSVVALVAGGAAAGWQPAIRLAQAVRVPIGGRVIEPEGWTAARWTDELLPTHRDTSIGANGGALSRLLLVYSRHPLGTGGVGGADNALELPGLAAWQIQLLRDKKIRYVLMDRLELADDSQAGYFFSTSISPPEWQKRLPQAVSDKFENQPTSRIFDSGNIVIYDIARFLAATGSTSAS